MEGHCDHVRKIVTGWCIWWLYCLQCYGICIPATQGSIQTFLRSLSTLNNSQAGKKHDCNSPINVFLREGRKLLTHLLGIFLSPPHVLRPTAGCLSIPRLGQLHHIFRFIMSNHFEMLSSSFYLLVFFSVFASKWAEMLLTFPVGI